MDPLPRRHRVLVVDDNLDTVQSMALLLRDMGHEVDFAINGYATLEVARRLRPQVVFLDLALPDIDGWLLARMLRREATLAGVRIYAVTGYGKERDRERSLEAGCDDHLLKPLDPKTIERLLG
jgi:CheY-like chemotaxis protein